MGIECCVERRTWLVKHHDHYTWSGKYQRPGVSVMDEEEFRQRVREEVEMTEEAFAAQLSVLAREGTTARQRVACCEEMEVDAIHNVNRFALFVPFCRVCWKQLDSVPQRSETDTMRGCEEDAATFSRMEGEWFQETVFLVRCAQCGRDEASAHRTHFRALPTAFALDGVPSLYLSSLEKEQLCPLCLCLLHYCGTRKRADKSPNPEWSIQIPVGERDRVMSHIRDVIHDMDQQVLDSVRSDSIAEEDILR